MTRVTLSLCAFPVAAALLCLAGLPSAGGAEVNASTCDPIHPHESQTLSASLSTGALSLL